LFEAAIMKEKPAMTFLSFVGCAGIGWVSFMGLVIFVTPDEAVLVVNDPTDVTVAKLGFSGLVGLLGVVLLLLYRFGRSRRLRRSTCVAILSLALISVVVTAFLLRLSWGFLMAFVEDGERPVIGLSNTNVGVVPLVGVVASFLSGAVTAVVRRRHRH
jgi:nitrate reductase gamma subunit